jgi:hypothetical protein
MSPSPSPPDPSAGEPTPKTTDKPPPLATPSSPDPTAVEPTTPVKKGSKGRSSPVQILSEEEVSRKYDIRKVQMELGHAEKRLELEHQAKIKELEHQAKSQELDHQAKTRESERGLIGKLLGTHKNAPNNVAFLAIVLSFVTILVLGGVYPAQWERIGPFVFPIITLSLGYMFGKSTESAKIPKSEERQEH